MAFNDKIIILFASMVSVAGCISGQSDFVPITQRAEAEQRQFAKDYLADGAPESRRYWSGELMDRSLAFARY